MHKFLIQVSWASVASTPNKIFHTREGRDLYAVAIVTTTHTKFGMRMYHDQTKHFRGQPTPIQGVGIPEPKFLKYMISMKNRMNLEQFSNLKFHRVE